MTSQRTKLSFRVLLDCLLRYREVPGIRLWFMDLLGHPVLRWEAEEAPKARRASSTSVDAFREKIVTWACYQ